MTDVKTTPDRLLHEIYATLRTGSVTPTPAEVKLYLKQMNDICELWGHKVVEASQLVSPSVA